MTALLTPTPSSPTVLVLSGALIKDCVSECILLCSHSDATLSHCPCGHSKSIYDLPGFQTFTQQTLPSESSLLVSSAHDCYFKFVSLSLKSLVPSFSGCLRPSLTIQVSDLDLTWSNIRLGKFSKVYGLGRLLLNKQYFLS